MRPCSGTVFDDQPVERPHIRCLSGVATSLRHLVDIPFPTDKLVERLFSKLKNWRRVATRYDKSRVISRFRHARISYAVAALCPRRLADVGI